MTWIEKLVAHKLLTTAARQIGLSICSFVQPLAIVFLFSNRIGHGKSSKSCRCLLQKAHLRGLGHCRRGHLSVWLICRYIACKFALSFCLVNNNVMIKSQSANSMAFGLAEVGAAGSDLLRWTSIELVVQCHRQVPFCLFLVRVRLIWHSIKQWAQVVVLRPAGGTATALSLIDGQPIAPMLLPAPR